MILTNYPIEQLGNVSRTQSWWRNKCCVYDANTIHTAQDGRTTIDTYNIPVMMARATAGISLGLMKVGDRFYIGGIRTAFYDGSIDDFIMWQGKLLVSRAGRVSCINGIEEAMYRDRTVKFAAFEVDGKEVLYYVVFRDIGSAYGAEIYSADDTNCMLAIQTYPVSPLALSYPRRDSLVVKGGKSVVAIKWRRSLHKYMPQWWKQLVADVRIIMIALPTEIFELIVAEWFLEEALLNPVDERDDDLLWGSVIGRDYLRINA